VGRVGFGRGRWRVGAERDGEEEEVGSEDGGGVSDLGDAGVGGVGWGVGSASEDEDAGKEEEEDGGDGACARGIPPKPGLADDAQHIASLETGGRVTSVRSAPSASFLFPPAPKPKPKPNTGPSRTTCAT